MLDENAKSNEVGMPTDPFNAGDSGGDQDDVSNRESDADASTIEAATATWLRRGYQVRYHDPFLTQLIRRDPIGWSSAPFVALAVATLIATAAAIFVAVQRRPWHVVTLVVGPDHRVLAHHQHAPHPPTP